MKRALTVVAIIAVVTACSSGGGSGTSSIPAKVAATAAPQAIGSTSLTIKFPAKFVRAKAAAVNAKAKKRPQYVNPVSGNYLDVYVNQQLVLIPGSGLSYDTAAISNTNGDGTQTVTIPLYSGAQQDILVTERDTDATQYGGDLLAIGQTSYTIEAGTQNFPEVSMNMNVASFGYSTDGSTATQISYEGDVNFACGPPSGNLFYLLALDPQGAGEFSTLAGSGGLPTLDVYAYTDDSASPPPTNLIQNALGQYFASFDSNDDPVSVYLGVNYNPAYYEYYQGGISEADENVLNPYDYSISPNPNVYFYLVSDC